MNVQCSSSRSFAKETESLDQLSVIIKADPLRTTWEVAEEFSFDHSMVNKHLKQIGKVKKLNKWVPHELTRYPKKKKMSLWSVVFPYSIQLSAMWEIRVPSLGWEDPLKEGMATHSSILAWRIPMDRESWQAAVHGVAKSQTQLSN